MDYENLTNNLQQNIEKFKSYVNGDRSYNVISRYMLDIANYHGYRVLGINNSYYIEKGVYPKAVLHLNIDGESDLEKLSLTYGENPVVSGDKNLNLIDSCALIASLLDLSTRDFDVLLTNNNIQNDNKSYLGLKDLLRTSNIINLNLRQSKCIADEFSALILSNVRVPLERADQEYPGKTFRLSLSNLMGGHTSEDLDKVRLNSIKTIISFFRRLKSKVDMRMVGFKGGDRYDNIPNFASIDFRINEDYQNDLFDIFNLYQSEFIEKNLKYEPDMHITLEEIEGIDDFSISDVSFDRLASFVELVPSGAFSVDQMSKDLISSINLSTVRTFEEFINLVIVYRSLSDDPMRDMLEKTHTAAKIASSEIISKLQIPRWENSDDSLTEMFRKIYYQMTGEELSVIKTQYSLDSSVIFRDLNVKIISLGVEYKQGEDDLYHTKLSDISLVANMIDEVISQIDFY